MSKQKKHQHKQQIDDEAAYYLDDETVYYLGQQNQYMKAEMRDIHYTMQGMKETSEKAEASCAGREKTQKDAMEKMQVKFYAFEFSNIEQAMAYGEEKQQQREEMDKIEERIQSLRADHSRGEAISEVEKGKRKDEMVEIKEKIQRQKEDMEEILAKSDAASKAEKGE